MDTWNQPRAGGGVGLAGGVGRALVALWLAVALWGCAEANSGRSGGVVEDIGEGLDGGAEPDAALPDALDELDASVDDAEGGDEDAPQPGCVPGATRCLDDRTNLLCEVDGRRETAFACPQETLCVEGTCAPIVCAPGPPRCEGNAVIGCEDGGTRATRVVCPEGASCLEGACVGIACEPGVTRCLDGRTALVCAEDGLSEIPMSCPAMGLCRDGACVPRVCVPGEVRCGDIRTVVTCDDEGASEDASLCEPEEVCREGACVPVVCSPRSTRCRDALTLLTCDLDGAEELASTCPQGTICRTDRCEATVCQQGARRCQDLRVILECVEEGTREDPLACAEGSVCEDGRCVPGCVPGSRRCLLDEVQSCQSDRRTWLTDEVCDPDEGFNCLEGQCAFSCEALSGKSQYLGCDFWAVDTINNNDLGRPFGFVVSNVDGVQTAQVRVEDSEGDVLDEAEIEPLRSAFLELEAPRALNNPTTGLRPTGIRIVTDVPVTAVQFNPFVPLDEMLDVRLQSADASLLLPNAALGTEYIVASSPHHFLLPGFFSVVSGSDDNTVTITTPSTVPRTRAGGDVPVIRPDEPEVFVLSRGEVLTVLTDQAGDDLTGTLIESEAPVAVFGGSDCAQVPVGCPFCDHTEEALFPVATWGVEYDASPTRRTNTSVDVWRIVASQNGTTVTLDPPLVEVPTLDRGTFFEFTTGESFYLRANAPVMLAQYMRGSTCTSIDVGDPSMLLVVPRHQYRRDHRFFTPEIFDEHRITLIGPEEARVVLDRASLSLQGGEPIGQTGYRALDLPVGAGRHALTSDLPVSVYVYGWGYNVSYAHPAGMDLSTEGP